MKKAILTFVAMAAIFALTSCATTQIFEGKAPNAQETDGVYNFLIITDGMTKTDQELAYKKFCMGLAKIGINAVYNTDFELEKDARDKNLVYSEPRYQKPSDESVKEFCAKNEIDAVLLICEDFRTSYERYVPETERTVYKTENRYGKEVTVAETQHYGGYTLELPIVFYKIELKNASSGALIFSCAAQVSCDEYSTSGNAIISSLSKKVVQEIAKYFGE